MNDKPLVVIVHQLALLAKEAADALWAMDHHKDPTRDPIVINQDIYRYLREHRLGDYTPNADDVVE